jgi:hypothetical protein
MATKSQSNQGLNTTIEILKHQDLQHSEHLLE